MTELVIDALYTPCIRMVEIQVFHVRKRSLREAQFGHDSYGNRIIYGSDSYDFALVVSDLRVDTDEDQQVEHVAWMAPAYLRVENPGEMLVEVEPAHEMNLTQKVRPLAHDIHVPWALRPLKRDVGVGGAMQRVSLCVVTRSGESRVRS